MKHFIRAFFKTLLVLMLLCVVGVGALYVVDNQNQEPIPEEIIEFGEKYPEASDYVRHFNKYKDKDFDMDVSKEMAERDTPLFIQWDKRWGYRDYGGNIRINRGRFTE